LTEKKIRKKEKKKTFFWPAKKNLTKWTSKSTPIPQVGDEIKALLTLPNFPCTTD
jgi:hypothetical protein